MAKSGYDFYLDKILLPVTPEKLTIKINSQNKTVNLINEGEINILKVPGLTDIDFEFIIPQAKVPYAKYTSGFKAAKYYLDKLESMKVNKTKFQFIVSRVMPNGNSLFSTNIKVVIEDYKIIEDADDGFDVKIKISLKQWKDWGTKTVKITVSNSKPKAKKKTYPSYDDEDEEVEDTPKTYKQGDLVNFHGGTHYVSSYPGSVGYRASAGQARITIANGSGKAHPWHLIHADSSSNVYGWVDD